MTGPDPSPIPPELEAELLRLLDLQGVDLRMRIDEMKAAWLEHVHAIDVWLHQYSVVVDEDPDIDDTAEKQVGPYSLLERIGRGGFGDVYVAEQREPFRRRVAIKLTKIGMDSGPVLQRFLRERQILAALNHEAIAKVFDGGKTPAGRAFFVMEYVEGGKPIAEYCDAHRLSIVERIRLFQTVCHGVQHSHEKGILHRDLKPSNILVTRLGDRHVPKIIDFGVAKNTSAFGGQGTLYTRHHQLIGTPEYMAPEQAAGEPVLTTAVDTYSLGVILYELLAGHLPFGSEVLRAKANDEVLRVLREQDPVKPSTKILEKSGSGAAARGAESTQLAECRGLRSLSAWTQMVRGDLDWITMMALRREPERRYRSPSEFAEDLQRFLDDKPVRARPPSLRYVAGKVARRYRTQLWAGVVVLTALLVAGYAILENRHLRTRNELKETQGMVKQLIFGEARKDIDRAAQQRIHSDLELLPQLPYAAAADKGLEIAEWTLEVGDAAAALRILDRLGRMPEEESRLRSLELRAEALLLTSPTQAPSVMETIATLRGKGDARLPAIVRRLSQETDILIPGVVDVHAPWYAEEVPLLRRDGTLCSWRLGGHERALAKLPPWVGEWLGMANPVVTFRTEAGPSSWYCLLQFGNKLLAFDLPRAGIATELQPLQVELAGPEIDPAGLGKLRTSLTVTRRDGTGRPDRIYVGVIMNHGGSGTRHDYEVDLSGKATAHTILRGKYPNSSTIATAMLSNNGDSLLVAAGEWGEFGFVLLDRREGVWKLRRERVGYVRSMVPLETGDNLFLLGVGSPYRSTYLFEDRGREIWQQGVRIARFDRDAPAMMHCLATDDFGERTERWHVIALANVPIMKGESMHVAVAANARRNGNGNRLRIYVHPDLTRHVKWQPLLVMRTALRGDNLLHADIDSDGDHELLSLQDPWRDADGPRVHVAGMKGRP